ncbi:MAG: chromosomal replication initiator protein DnaA [Chloroflexi bacterium]|nr:chromosomal replication initiator protein DnaA [Chloroflexota bacterium]
MNARQVWQAVLGDLQVQVSPPIYDTWLRTTSILDFADGQVVVGAPNTFAVEQLRTRFTTLIQRSLATILGYPVAVDFAVAGDDDEDLTAVPQRPANRSAPAPAHGQQLVLEATPAHGLNPEYVFDTFIVGKSNQFAHAASVSVAHKPGQKFNPLFLHGDVGLGKTHLLHAAGHRAMELFPGFQVLYVSSEKFTNELIRAIREQRTDEFRARYRSIDMLLIDDIQFIAGKEATQEEFFHTFNALHQAGKQIIISSDRPPRLVPTLADRLRSRFEGGLISEVEAPDTETRVAYLRDRAERLSISAPAAVMDYLAQKMQANFRELSGALNRVTALAEAQAAPITLALASQALNDVQTTTRRRQVTPDRIIQTVSGFYRVPVGDLVSKSRRKEIVLPRQVAMYLIRTETDTSLGEIGAALGGRDHTTVMYSCDTIKKRIEADSFLRQHVLTLREQLYAGE